MYTIQIGEALAARRTIVMFVGDATTPHVGETEENAGQPQISVNGGAFGNTVNTLVTLGSGQYKLVLDQTNDLTAMGFSRVRYKSANTAEAFYDIEVVGYDPHQGDNLGLSALPTAAPAASGGLPTVGTGAGQINPDGSGRVYTDLRLCGGITVGAGAIPNAGAGALGGLPTVNNSNQVLGVEAAVVAGSLGAQAKLDVNAEADTAITDGKAAIAVAVADTDLATYEAAAKSGTKLGNMLAAARAGAFGKLDLAAGTLTLYEVDGVTVIATFTIAADYSTRTAPV